MMGLSPGRFGPAFQARLHAGFLLAIGCAVVVWAGLRWTRTGFVVRVVTSKEFRRHDPEMFALHVSGAIVTACATVLAFVLPVTLAPPMLCAVPVAFALFTARAVANFHRRG